MPEANAILKDVIFKRGKELIGCVVEASFHMCAETQTFDGVLTRLTGAKGRPGKLTKYVKELVRFSVIAIRKNKQKKIVIEIENYVPNIRPAKR